MLNPNFQNANPPVWNCRRPLCDVFVWRQSGRLFPLSVHRQIRIAILFKFGVINLVFGVLRTVLSSSTMMIAGSWYIWYLPPTHADYGFRRYAWYLSRPRFIIVIYYIGGLSRGAQNFNAIQFVLAAPLLRSVVFSFRNVGWMVVITGGRVRCDLRGLGKVL